MPSSKSKKSGRSSSDSQLCHFKFLSSTALVAANGSLSVAPVAALSPRAAVEADVWALYRFRKLRFRLRRNTAIASYQIAAFVPGVTDSLVPSITGLSEVIPRCLLASTDTVPTDWCVVSKADLAGYQPWYKTVAGTPDASVEVLGTIVFAGSGTDSVALEIEGTIEFRDAVPASMAPMLRTHQELADKKRAAYTEKERARVLALFKPTAAARPTTSDVELPSALLRV